MTGFVPNAATCALCRIYCKIMSAHCNFQWENIKCLPEETKLQVDGDLVFMQGQLKVEVTLS